MAVARKTVTVLFADVADSTALGERLDAESVRSALSRWFELARAAVERHGGTVEKFVGDAVMAIFGVPRLHEDDALRAVRAADEMRRALARLNAELVRERGVELAVRIGVNTGEVVAGDGGGTLVTGDAVNVAKRLEETAEPGEVVVGDETRQLSRARARFEQLEPLLAKGKSVPLRVWRLVDVDPGSAAAERPHDTPFVGRRRELEQLRRAYGRSVAERTCHLFTLLGTAGIGKSRLACELFDDVDDEASVLVGHCLPYGDGITFWPLVEVLRQLGDEDALRALLADARDAELVAERLAGVTGHATVDAQETFWAVRQLFEALARRRPLVVCFEDVHWAESTLLDLVEYLAAWIHDAPILLLCLARPEFLDHRPAWLSGQENAASLTLPPLSAGESDELLDALGTTGEARAQIGEVAAGNPLYAEQIAAMLAEAGGRADVRIPPTIQALLAARLDRLTAAERAVVDRAAVCGKEFWRDALAELTGAEERAQLGTVLMSLVRKDLIRPHRSSARPDDAFRFGHVLIRDAAYAAIPKETRAVLHERFADWVEATAGERALELEEIVGYHLEQAYRFREQLGPVDDAARRVGERAGSLLAAAGERAFRRSDMPAAVSLLKRAVALLGEKHHVRLHAQPLLGSALIAVGEFALAETVLDAAHRAAAAVGDKRLELRAAIERAFLRTFTNPEGSTDELVRVAESSIPVLEELDDDRGLAKAWWLRSEADAIAARWAERAEALERALFHARRAGDTRTAATVTALLAQALECGPTPVPAAIRRCEELRHGARGERAVGAGIDCTLAALHAMEGRFDEARETYRRAQSSYDELGLLYMRAVRSLEPALVELLAGDADAAVHELRAGYEALERMGERGVRSTIAAYLAQTLVAQGSFDEAESFARIAAETGAVDDVVTQATWRSAHACCLARGGDAAQAERLAREAVALADSTDFLELQARTLLDLADVLALAGRTDEPIALRQRAGDRFARKGNVAAAEHLAVLVAETREPA
jgi:class 3 adenylate cyclase/tetratricopeptide (TPR) repeat protein